MNFWSPKLLFILVLLHISLFCLGFSIAFVFTFQLISNSVKSQASGLRVGLLTRGFVISLSKSPRELKMNTGFFGEKKKMSQDYIMTSLANSVHIAIAYRMKDVGVASQKIYDLSN